MALVDPYEPGRLSLPAIHELCCQARALLVSLLGDRSESGDLTMHGGWHKREILPFWIAQSLVLHVLGRTIDDDAPQLYTTAVLARYPL